MRLRRIVMGAVTGLAVVRTFSAEPTGAQRQLMNAVVQARLMEGERKFAAAATNYSIAVQARPDAAELYMLRGCAWFRAGELKASVSDFDEVNRLSAERAPHNWQRGIALYYAGRFRDGREQFELHQTVNPNDVENAVWHFLCTVRDLGLDEARKRLISIRGDSRIPMAEIHRLFAGKATEADVLGACKRTGDGQAAVRNHRFYAELYLGLYAEALGNTDAARHHMRVAAGLAGEGDYMGDVARFHARLLVP